MSTKTRGMKFLSGKKDGIIKKTSFSVDMEAERVLTWVPPPVAAFLFRIWQKLAHFTK